MSEPIPPFRRVLQAFISAFDPKSSVLIYAFGVIVWVIATVLIGMRPGESEILYGLLEAFGTAWLVAFGYAVAAVALGSLIACLKHKKSLLGVLSNTILFSSPFALFLLGKWTLDALYERHPATEEMIALFGPILMLFYIVGILYMRWRTTTSRDAALAAFMLSTCTAVILILGLTGFKLFTSSEYIYRDAFQVSVQKVDIKGDTATVSGVVTIKKPGSYVFGATRNDQEIYSEELSKPLQIEWGGKSPASGEMGDHPFRITLANIKKIREMRGNPAFPDGSLAFGPELYLQISLPSENGLPGVYLKGIPIWLSEY